MSATTADAEFAEFVRARQHPLIRAARLYCGDHHAAEDLVQDALIKLASRWESVREGSPDAYVRRILYRDAVSRWRKWGREIPYAVQAGEPDLLNSGVVPAQVDAWVEGSQVRQALAQLPPRQRAVIVLRYFEDQSEADIADTLGCSTGTVKSQASKALQKLRSLMPEVAGSTRTGGGER
ncbi:SigE family RNA polymerase sigma factor [Ornithinimicrobium pratense]|uniref:SigE family RNA polymerase sigma factor n=1 Tax=Ornithinimicrobium pratense TaxID=2593973 RepID=A0A5J6V6R4_9MICO|nr:SigE family RNA polymerase sigma factor [Ornithinimicrobium pratense]QFG68871.1 SigE family RNA polymerase sigma factor [Ornithinimicrobium pratense]